MWLSLAAALRSLADTHSCLFLRKLGCHSLHVPLPASLLDQTTSSRQSLDSISAGHWTAHIQSKCCLLPLLDPKVLASLMQGNHFEGWICFLISLFRAGFCLQDPDLFSEVLFHISQCVIHISKFICFH